MYLGSAPISPELPIPPSIVTALCAGLSLFALFWVRPRIPPRPVTLLIFLLEGSAMVGAVWTLWSGSWMTAAASFLSIGLLALNGPERFERAADGFDR